MVFSNVIFDVKKMRKINRTLQKILIWIPFGLYLAKVFCWSATYTFLRHQLGYNCDINC